MDTVTVTILDKEYQVACPPEQKSALLRSAHTLDQRMREVRDTGKVFGLDRIAVMAALNLSHDLLSQEEQVSHSSDAVDQKVTALTQRVDRALTDLRQLKL